MERIYQDEGPDALAKIGLLSDPRNFASTNLFGLFDEKGVRLAGNLKAPPEVPGWMRKDFEGLYPEPNGTYLITSKVIKGGKTVAVGRSLTPITNVLRVLLLTVLTTAAAAAVIRMLVSYSISRQTFAKLEAMTGTLEKVAGGDLDARVVVGRGSEQLDKAARLINGHLDHLKHVVESNKNTINAIAHDLRSPLNRVSILLDDALAAGDASFTAAKLLDAQAEIENLTEIFDTTLRISRLRASAGQEGFSMISLSELVIEMGEIFAPVAEDHGDTLIVETHPGPPLKVFADTRMVRQMLVNLIENATNHCPKGVTITLRVKATDSGGVVEVCDTGPGIPVGQRLAVLEPFERLDRSRSTPGTGLGLALVAAIAGRHDATIELDDNEPGLVVRVIFPLADTEAKLSNL
ncbi:HAMP domain-containing sensor histidine kinase [Hoeflea sp. AS60]|uniref:sensor histidine kinase n=1 Tax=Hoeflea sp. AS60 TaxID=3135780 RepID=UPI003171EEDA